MQSIQGFSDANVNLLSKCDARGGYVQPDRIRFFLDKVLLVIYEVAYVFYAISNYNALTLD